MSITIKTVELPDSTKCVKILLPPHHGDLLEVLLSLKTVLDNKKEI